MITFFNHIYLLFALFVLTIVDGRTNYAKEISALLRDTYGDKIKVFGTDIPHSV
jgi:chromosome partitioning protein